MAENKLIRITEEVDKLLSQKAKKLNVSKSFLVNFILRKTLPSVKSLDLGYEEKK